MEIEELVRRKALLEADIREFTETVLANFQRNTGVAVSGVRIDLIDVTTNESKIKPFSVVGGVEIEIRIGWTNVSLRRQTGIVKT